MSTQVKSPCINVCKYDEEEICIGCHRTMDEITGWLFMTEDRKKEIVEAVALRRKTPRPGKNNYDHYV